LESRTALIPINDDFFDVLQCGGVLEESHGSSAPQGFIVYARSHLEPQMKLNVVNDRAESKPEALVIDSSLWADRPDESMSRCFRPA
jgi:hypothetical protein